MRSLVLSDGCSACGFRKNLYATFGGPWADGACRAQDVDVHVPDEYLTNAAIRDKLPPIKLNRFPEDLLFYLFYNYPGDVLQMAAAAELYAHTALTDTQTDRLRSKMTTANELVDFLRN